MERIKWELMRPQDIEVRPAMVKDGKATLLLFQNSRTTMDALDRNFGEFGWKIEYKAVGEQIYGRLSIKDPETGEWVCKEDTGEESNISAQKGQSSDILKRCAVRFGYARELYSAPRIVVPDDGYNCSGYKVSSIVYNDNREIIELHIVNRFGKPVFDWNYENGLLSTNKPVEQTQEQSQERPTNTILDGLKNFCQNLKGNVDKTQLVNFYRFYEPKAQTWRGKMDYQTLWSRWIERAV